MKRIFIFLASVALGTSFLIGCRSNELNIADNNADSQKLDITVSILPQEYFVKKIGGDRVDVNVMVEPGTSAEIYEPKPQQLKTLNQAEAYVTVGMPFEGAWMDKFKGINPKILIINSAQGIEPLEMAEHHHHDEDEKNHEESDPHIWLSPELVKIQAKNIYDGLVQLDPAHEAVYKTNLTQFLTEIDQLDQQIRQNLAGLTNRKFIVFHPAWTYFAHDYNLEQIPIEVGGQEPSALELGNLIKIAQKENIKVIFAQYQFNANDAKTIAKEINGEVIFIDDLAPNWSENLLKVSQTLREQLKTR